ncbi:MAG: ATP-binding protein, partial [Microbacterium sp.]
DSHDRYANLEVAYLLQRMEAYRGLAILTTNLRGHLDRAFLRRIRFVVQFPFPDAASRARIWARVIPATAPTEGIDPVALAGMQLSGGSIRAIALSAAFAAADAGTAITPAHLLHAARLEVAKSERALTDAETAAFRVGGAP